jgi:hypothetical protein
MDSQTRTSNMKRVAPTDQGRDRKREHKLEGNEIKTATDTTDENPGRRQSNGPT